MSSSATLEKPSIFKHDADYLPVKPVRTARNFGVLDRTRLSAEGLQKRINRLVHQEESPAPKIELNAPRVSPTAETFKSDADAKIAQLFNVPNQAPQLYFLSTFSPIKEWEGYVNKIGEHSIFADLVDISGNKRMISDQAEIPLDELLDADRPKLQLGSIFRWSIGYQRTAGGTKRRVSNIVFRELPQWTKRDLRLAQDGATKLDQYFAAGRSKLPNFDEGS